METVKTNQLVSHSVKIKKMDFFGLYFFMLPTIVKEYIVHLLEIMLKKLNLKLKILN